MTKPAKYGRVAVALAGLFACAMLAYSVDATVGKKTKLKTVPGIVTDSHGRPLEGAMVYLIDASTIDTTAITSTQIRTGDTAAESVDEPLEDIVNNADKVKLLPQAKTNKLGKFSIKKVNLNSNYFAFVVPASTDYLPGGSASRNALSPKSLPRTGLAIQVSWSSPAEATYIGSSACYTCHGAGSKSDMTSNKKHGHILQFHKLAGDTANQNAAGHAGSDWNSIASKFVSATSYLGTGVTKLYFQQYQLDTTVNFGNRFVVNETKDSTTIDPTTGKAGEVWLTAYLWKDSSGKFYVTLENTINKSDPKSPMTLEATMTFGGYIRQRLLLKVPGLNGHYTFLTYQALTGSPSQGSTTTYDRSRRAWVEGGVGGSITNFFDPTTSGKYVPAKRLLKLPTSATSNVSCAECHLGMGSYREYDDPVTGEHLATTVADANGVFDLAGNGTLQDVGVTCEQCHGPGSKHRDEALKQTTPVTTDTKKKSKKVTDYEGKYIVNPELLGADRSSLICGRCHDGRGIVKEDSATFPRPGISRKDYLSTYVDAKFLTASPGQLWNDGVHGRGGHHGFTYSNWLLSKHARNSRQMVACDDCHDSMGDSPYRFQLKGDPDDSQAGLCSKCHTIDVITHVPEKTGSQMSGAGMKCLECHMTRTGKGGAGRLGLLLGTPTGVTTNDSLITYWQGDQSSHVFDMPHKFQLGTAGVTPGGASPNFAMPNPYTHSCGTCHDASKLQYQSPQ